MKNGILSPRFTLLLIAICFSVSFSYGQQQPRIVGKPLTEAYDFAVFIAQTIKFNAPDTARTTSNAWRVRMVLLAPGDESKWLTVDFMKDRESDIRNIESVSITGNFSEIIDLYAILYDKSVRKVNPEDVYQSVDKDGEIKVVRTDVQTQDYKGEMGTFGRIYICESNHKK